MGRSSYGSGTIFQRGQIWYVSYWADGHQIQKSSKSTKRGDAVKLRDELIGKKTLGELRNPLLDRVTCGELLKDFLEHSEANLKQSTVRIWKYIVNGNLIEFFGHRTARSITTDVLKSYRRKRRAEGRSETTCNRELSLLRIAFNLGRKCTPPKVTSVPYFPMVKEENARQGFLTDEQYFKLRDALPDELKPLCITAYFTGVRLGELLAWKWDQVDFEQGFVTLRAEATKSGHSRVVPILEGDMKRWLLCAYRHANGCECVFHRDGEPIKKFRRSWMKACKAAGLPELKFHDLRRTAVRNMRRAGVSQVVRMRISGHRTDSMERRYNIVDVEDMKSAKALMEDRLASSSKRRRRSLSTNTAGRSR